MLTKFLFKRPQSKRMRMVLERFLLVSSYFAAAIFVCWPLLFESWEIPVKIDSTPHILHIVNLISAFKSGSLFPAWQVGPFMGYAENLHCIAAYLIPALLSFVLPFSLSIKCTFLILYVLRGVLAERMARAILGTRQASWIVGLVYITAPSDLIFGLGAGSITRVAAAAVLPGVVCGCAGYFASPSHRKGILAASWIVLLYLCHPPSAMNLLILLPLLYAAFSKNSLKIDSIKWLCALLVLAFIFTAWQAVPAYLGQRWVSYGSPVLYSSLISLNWKSFFGLFLFGTSRQEYYYLGSLSVLCLIALAIARMRKLRVSWHRSPADDFILISFAAGVLSLLLAPWLMTFEAYRAFVQFPFRHAVIFNIALSLAAGRVLVRIRHPGWLFLAVLAIVWDGSAVYRDYGGRDYLYRDYVDHLSPLLKKGGSDRVDLDYRGFTQRTHHRVIAQNSYLAGLERSIPLDLLGFVEMAPHNLGYLYMDGQAIGRDEMSAFLGITERIVSVDGIPRREAVSENAAGVRVYSRFAAICADSKESAYFKVYSRLLRDDEFSPLRMPIIFRGHSDFTTAGFCEYDQEEPLLHDWMFSRPDFAWAQIFAGQKYQFFDSMRQTPKGFEFEGSGSQGQLVVLSEAFHPRRFVVLNGRLVETLAVEPGLIGFILSDSGIFRGLVVSSYMSWELIVMLFSLVIWAMALCWTAVFSLKWQYQNGVSNTANCCARGADILEKKGFHSSTKPKQPK